MIIQRIVEGKEYCFELTPLEISAVYDEGRIANARNVLELHQEEIEAKSYKYLMNNKERLLALGTALDAALYDDNSDIEYRVLCQFLRWTE